MLAPGRSTMMSHRSDESCIAPDSVVLPRCFESNLPSTVCWSVMSRLGKEFLRARGLVQPGFGLGAFKVSRVDFSLSTLRNSEVRNFSWNFAFFEWKRFLHNAVDRTPPNAPAWFEAHLDWLRSLSLKAVHSSEHRAPVQTKAWRRRTRRTSSLLRLPRLAGRLEELGYFHCRASWKCESRQTMLGIQLVSSAWDALQ